MAAEEGPTLEYTPTWVVAIVCSVIVAISLAVERLLHYTGKACIVFVHVNLFSASIISISLIVLDYFGKLIIINYSYDEWLSLFFSISRKRTRSLSIKPYRRSKKVTSTLRSLSLSITCIYIYMHTHIYIYIYRVGYILGVPDHIVLYCEWMQSWCCWASYHCYSQCSNQRLKNFAYPRT